MIFNKYKRPHNDFGKKLIVSLLRFISVFFYHNVHIILFS